ncbi:MAG: glycoside hydrolase family 15 protein [Spirochaetota bacterium]
MITDIDKQRERLKQVSISLILENQHSSGSFVASPTFSQYGYSWLRDGTYIAYSLLLNGYVREVRAHIQWVSDVIARHAYKIQQLPALLASSDARENQWFLSARYTLEGEEDTSDWPNFQIDGYGSWLWLVAQYLKTTQETLPDDWNTSVELIVDYLGLVWNLPNSDCWEEFNGEIHPATLACLAGGVKHIKDFVGGPYRHTCEELGSNITTFILEHIHEDGYFPKFIGSDMIDASLIWLSVPYGVVAPNHPAMVKTIKKIEQDITFKGGVKRYPQDTYYGGGQWLLLSAFLGWYYVRVGDAKRAEELLNWIISQQEDDGSLSEQILEEVNDPSMVKPWEKRWGKVATPLLWSHAMFLILDNELSVYNTKGEKHE